MTTLPNIADFQAWVRAAQPGDCACYFTGMSVSAAAEYLRFTKDDPSLHRLCAAVYGAYSAGYVHLTQRVASQRDEHGVRKYEYLVTRSSKPANDFRAVVREAA